MITRRLLKKLHMPEHTPLDRIRAKLAAIKEAEQASTKGPWTAEDHKNWAYPYVSVEDAINRDAIRMDWPHGIGATWGTRGKLEVEIDNAKFIALSKNSTPALVQAVEHILDELTYMQECDDIFDRRKQVRQFITTLADILDGNATTGDAK